MGSTRTRWKPRFSSRNRPEPDVTVVSVGSGFVMDVMKKPLSMGADNLILVDDPAVADLDAFATARALAEASRKVGGR